VDQLVERVRTVIEAKAKFPIDRLGLCATSFDARPKNGGIVSFFALPSSSSLASLDANAKNPDDAELHPSQMQPVLEHEDPDIVVKLINKVEKDGMGHLEVNKECPPYEGEHSYDFHNHSSVEHSCLQSPCFDGCNSFQQVELEERTMKDSSRTGQYVETHSANAMKSPSGTDTDFEYARKLQNLYDREEAILSSVDNKRIVSIQESVGKRSIGKRQKIDSFFLRKK